MIRRPPRSTQSRSSAASDVYKRQVGERRSGPRREGHSWKSQAIEEGDPGGEGTSGRHEHGAATALQLVVTAVQSNATERLLPAKVEPAACSRGKVTVKRYALMAPAANDPRSRPRSPATAPRYTSRGAAPSVTSVTTSWRVCARLPPSAPGLSTRGPVPSVKRPTVPPSLLTTKPPLMVWPGARPFASSAEALPPATAAEPLEKTSAGDAADHCTTTPARMPAVSSTMSSVAAMRDPVALLLVAVRFIIKEASVPGFPPPIGTAVRLAG